MADPKAIQFLEGIYSRVDKQVRDIVSSMLPGITIAAQDDGTVIANDHRIINFQGPGVAVADEPSLRRVNVYVPGAPVEASSTVVVSNTSAKALSLYTSGSSTEPAYTTAVLADSPWGYWKMHETSGTSMADSSGNGHGGTFDSSIVTVAGPYSGWSAARFTTDGAVVASVPSQTTPMAFEMWSYGRWPGGSQNIAFDYTNSSGTQGLECGAQNVGGCGPNVAVDWLNPDSGWHCSNHPCFDSGTWRHTVIQLESDGHWYAYSRKAGDTVHFKDDLTGLTMTSATAPTSPSLYISRRYNGALPFVNDMSHFAFYDHALTLTRITAHWNAAQGGTPGNSAPPTDWDQPSYSDSSWTSAVVAGTEPGEVVPSSASPVWAAASPAADSEQVLLRQTFTLPAGAVAAAYLELAADDALYDSLTHINGHVIGTALGTVGSPSNFSVPPSLLTPGASNLLAFWGKNVNPTAAWVGYKLTVSYVAPGTDDQYIPWSTMTTKGDLIVGTGAGTGVRLGVGTNGYVLTANSSATNGVDWEAAGGGGGGMTNPMTTQDDIIVGGSSGTPGRLAKGSDSQVLTIDPASHHVAWATPSGGGGGGVIAYQLLSSAASQIDVSSIPGTYNILMVTVGLRSDQSSQHVWNVKLNNDSTSGHYNSAAGGSGSMRIGVCFTSNYSATMWSVNYLYFPAYGSVLATHNVHVPTIPRPDGTSNDYNAVIWTPSSSQAINQITVYPNTGNFVAGSWILVQGY